MGARDSSALLALVLLCCGCEHLQLVSAFSFNPFQGQGVPPPGPVKLYLTVLVERVLSVDQRNYGFEAIVYYDFSWKDPRAHEAITRYSKQQNDPSYNNGAGCMRFCDDAYEQPWGRLAGPNMTSSRQCCDGVWLPSFAFRNAATLPEGRTEPLWSIAVAPDKQTVTWRLTVHGTYFTPMDFHRFPFDSQELIIELSTTQAAPDRLQVVPSATSHKLFVLGAGDDLSTWDVQGVHIVVEPPVVGVELLRGSSPVNPDEAAPQSGVNATAAQLQNAIVPHLYYCVTNIHIQVSRLWMYYLWVAILPVVFLVWVAHVTFFMGPPRLNDRVSVLITLLLALVALQWVINANLPDSSYLLPTSQLVLLSYGCLGLMVLVSVLVYKISMYKSLHIEQLRREAALNRFQLLKAQLDADAPDITAPQHAPKHASAQPIEHDGSGPQTPAGRPSAETTSAGAKAAAAAADESTRAAALYHRSKGSSNAVQTGPVTSDGYSRGWMSTFSSQLSIRKQRNHSKSNSSSSSSSSARFVFKSQQLQDCEQPVQQLLTRTLSRTHPRSPQSSLKRWWLFYNAVLMDEEVAALLAHRVDKVCYTVLFVLFNVVGVLLLVLPHYV